MDTAKQEAKWAEWRQARHLRLVAAGIRQPANNDEAWTAWRFVRNEQVKQASK
jgi:hypothetical protein